MPSRKIFKLDMDDEHPRARSVTPIRRGPIKPTTVPCLTELDWNIFSKRIPGSDWKYLVNQRDKLASMASDGHHPGARGHLRRMMSYMQVEKMWAEKRVLESRGIGLCPMRWDIGPNLGWESVDQEPARSNKDLIASHKVFPVIRGKKLPAELPLYAITRTLPTEIVVKPLKRKIKATVKKTRNADKPKLSPGVNTLTDTTLIVTSKTTHPQIDNSLELFEKNVQPTNYIAQKIVSQNLPSLDIKQTNLYEREFPALPTNKHSVYPISKTSQPLSYLQIAAKPAPKIIHKLLNNSVQKTELLTLFDFIVNRPKNNKQTPKVNLNDTNATKRILNLPTNTGEITHLDLPKVNKFTPKVSSISHKTFTSSLSTELEKSTGNDALLRSKVIGYKKRNVWFPSRKTHTAPQLPFQISNSQTVLTSNYQKFWSTANTCPIGWKHLRETSPKQSINHKEVIKYTNRFAPLIKAPFDTSDAYNGLCLRGGWNPPSKTPKRTRSQRRTSTDIPATPLDLQSPLPTRSRFFSDSESLSSSSPPSTPVSQASQQSMTYSRESCPQCKRRINENQSSRSHSCGCRFHTLHYNKCITNGMFDCPRHGVLHMDTEDLVPLTSTQLTGHEQPFPESFDNYSAMINTYGGERTQEELRLYGIEDERSQSQPVSQLSLQERTSSGTFGTGEKCVFCTKPVDNMIGYGVLRCGHKFHWEKPFADWVTKGSNLRCPLGNKCPSKRTARKNCTECHTEMGMGCFETTCYCGSDKLHAEELQNKLTATRGKCENILPNKEPCGRQHPGFCSLCDKLFSLLEDGVSPRKVYVPCCSAYFHLTCWNTKQPDFCPNDGTPIANIRTVIIDPVNLCRVPVVHFPIQLPQPRGRMGGRAFVGTSSRASSRTPTSRSRTASESSVPGIDVATPESEAGRLMPPPSGTSVRRSIRLTQASTRPPSAAPAPVQQPSEPITRQCHTNHSKHFGIGCASKAANHLPPYYNSLAQGVFTCPHCGALLLYSEAHGPTAFSKCCAKGTVDLRERYQQLQNRTPQLQALFTNAENANRRQELIRHSMEYNDVLALGHIMVDRAPRDFAEHHRIVKLNNMIQYMLWDYNAPNQNAPLLHGQLFTIPPAEARERLNDIGAERHLNPELLDILHNMMRQTHPLAQVYMTASETFQQLNEDDRLNMRLNLVETNRLGRERPVPLDEEGRRPLDLNINPDDAPALQQIHPGRLNVPNELGSRLVAQIYLDTGANVPEANKYDVILKGRQGTGMVKMPWFSRLVDTVLFPLLFFGGQFGFENAIPLVGREPRARAEQHDNSADEEPDNLVESQTDTEEDEPELNDDASDAPSDASDPNIIAEERDNTCISKRNAVSMAQWFRYMAQVRGGDWRREHWLWDWGNLAQFYTISFNNRMEAQKVQYMKRLQGMRNIIRPGALLDWLEKLRDGQGLQGPIGRAFFTDEHFRASRQYFQKKYADVMTMFRHHGNPDLFLTFTMDPDAPELEQMLPLDANGQRQQWYDRPSEICRLFIDKYREFMTDIFDRQIMGPVKCGASVLEHQKRGLPHIHVLVTLDWDRMRAMGRINTKEEYMDQYISAEIPSRPTGRTADDQRRRELYNIITTKNIHTCNAQRCKKDNDKCDKRYPMQISDMNIYSEGHYPLYRRRPPAPSEEERRADPERYGNSLVYADGRQIDNSWVVPYNPLLSLKYRAHINAEIVAGAACAQYMTKYVTKGADMAFVRLYMEGLAEGDRPLCYDEFHQMRLARYITSMEAFMSLWNVPLIWMSDQIDVLDVHLPEGKRIAVEIGHEEEAAIAEEQRRAAGIERVTQLTSYFTFNRERAAAGEPALGQTYATCYRRLRYVAQNSCWQMRVVQPKKKNIITRLKPVSPANPELMALRTLLFHVLDPTCWEDLRRDPADPNVVYETFVESATARGLLADNQIWRRIIDDHLRTTRTIRQRLRWLAVFFATANLPNPIEIFDELMAPANIHWLVSSRVANSSAAVQRQYVLQALEWFLRANGIRPDDLERDDGTYETACEHIGLPRPEGCELGREEFVHLEFFPDDVLNNRLEQLGLQAEEAADRINMEDRYREIFLRDSPNANEEQKAIIEKIYQAVVDAKNVISGEQTHFTPTVNRHLFVTGEGGAGKTWTFNVAIAKLWATGYNFLPLASTGVAADLLYGGQTVHKRICRAKHVNSSTQPNVDRESAFADFLRNIHGLLIDEISMQNRAVLEYVDRLLRSVAPPHLQNVPFAGKAIIISGDWKQLLPVIAGGNIAHQVAACVKRSPLFQDFETLRLTANQRLGTDQEAFRNYLLRLGTGVINDSTERVQLPPNMCLFNREDLINYIFPDSLMSQPLTKWRELVGRAILSPLNKDTLALNQLLMDRLPGEQRVYTGTTRVVPDALGADALAVNIADADYENLIREAPTGIPEHRLRIRIGAIMMLTRNISVTEGLCNGTRVQILPGPQGRLMDNIIRVRILTGSAEGKLHDLHPVRFIYGGDPDAPNEGPIKTERIQFPLRPGSVMTINKSQGQTLTHVGVLLDQSQCFSPGQLYTSVTRGRNKDNIKIAVSHPSCRVKNIVMRDILDRDDLDAAEKPAPPDDPFPNQRPQDLPEEAPDVPQQPHAPNVPPQLPPTHPVDLTLHPSVTRDHLNRIRVITGNIVHQRVSMIVNAANRQLRMGGGVDNAIHYSCQPQMDQLKAELAQIHRSNGRDLADGQVVITRAYGDLAQTYGVQHIAHAVGPQISSGSAPSVGARTSLQSCYSGALNALVSVGGTTIAFPSISTGVFGYPRREASEAALEAILEWLATQDPGNNVHEIQLVVCRYQDEKLYKELIERVKRQIVRNRPRTQTRPPTLRLPTTTPAPITLTPLPPEPHTPTLQVPPTTIENVRLSLERMESPSRLPVTPDRRQVPTTSRTIQLENAEGLGDCFFDAICFALFHRHDRYEAARLRRSMYGFMQQTVLTPANYPRSLFREHDHYLQWLGNYAIVGGYTDDNLRILLNNYAISQMRLGVEATIGDSTFAAMLLQRPVVIVRPREYPWEILRLPEHLRPQWNSDNQILEIFFPDGSTMTMDRNMSHQDLQNFVARAPAQYWHENDRVFRQLLDQPEITRQVDRPIIIFYNGYNHFQTIFYEHGNTNLNAFYQQISPSVIPVCMRSPPRADERMEVEEQLSSISSTEAVVSGQQEHHRPPSLELSQTPTTSHVSPIAHPVPVDTQSTQSRVTDTAEVEDTSRHRQLSGGSQRTQTFTRKEDQLPSLPSDCYVYGGYIIQRPLNNTNCLFSSIIRSMHGWSRSDPLRSDTQRYQEAEQSMQLRRAVARTMALRYYMASPDDRLRLEATLLPQGYRMGRRKSLIKGLLSAKDYTFLEHADRMFETTLDDITTWAHTEVEALYAADVLNRQILVMRRLTTTRDPPRYELIIFEPGFRHWVVEDMHDFSSLLQEIDFWAVDTGRAVPSTVYEPSFLIPKRIQTPNPIVIHQYGRGYSTIHLHQRNKHTADGLTNIENIPDHQWTPSEAPPKKKGLLEKIGQKVLKTITSEHHSPIAVNNEPPLPILPQRPQTGCSSVAPTKKGLISRVKQHLADRKEEKRMARDEVLQRKSEAICRRDQRRREHFQRMQQLDTSVKREEQKIERLEKNRQILAEEYQRMMQSNAEAIDREEQRKMTRAQLDSQRELQKQQKQHQYTLQKAHIEAKERLLAAQERRRLESDPVYVRRRELIAEQAQIREEREQLIQLQEESQRLEHLQAQQRQEALYLYRQAHEERRRHDRRVRASRAAQLRQQKEDRKRAQDQRKEWELMQMEAKNRVPIAKEEIDEEENIWQSLDVQPHPARTAEIGTGEDHAVSSDRCDVAEKNRRQELEEWRRERINQLRIWEAEYAAEIERLRSDEHPEILELPEVSEATRNPAAINVQERLNELLEPADYVCGGPEGEPEGGFSPALLHFLPREIADGLFEECAICNMNRNDGLPIFTGRFITRLECGHVFHHNCIRTELQYRKTCPLCRHPVNPRDL